MSKTVWLITGAGRGMGTDIAVWMRSPCCACVASGHAIAVLLSTPRNSRRLMSHLCSRRGHRSAEDYHAGRGTRLGAGLTFR